MSINNKQQIYTSSLIVNPLVKHDNDLARKIFLMEDPKHVEIVKKKLKNDITELEALKKSFETTHKQSQTELGNLHLKITEYASENFIFKIIKAIVNLIFKRPSELVGLQESQRKWAAAHHKSEKRLKIVNDGLEIANKYLQEDVPQLDEAIKNAKQLILKDIGPNFQIEVDGFRCDASNVIDKLDAIAPEADCGKFILMQLSTKTLLTLLKHAIKDVLQQSNRAEYQVEDVNPIHEIHIKKNLDGSLEISTATLFHAKGPRCESLHLKSEIRLLLSANGTIENAIVSNEVRLHPKPHPSTALSTKVQDEYCKIPKTTLKDYRSIQLDDAQAPVWVSKDFVRDCARQIDYLQIEGCESIAKKRQAQKKHLEEITREYLEKNQVDPKGAKTLDLDAQSNAIKEQSNKDILQDFLKAIRDKLGPNRQHLLPTVTYLFGPASAAPLTNLITMHYDQNTHRIEPDKQFFTLNIPEDETLPISISCRCYRTATDKQGKNDLLQIEAQGVYTIHPSGRVSLNGEVTDLHEMSLTGLITGS